MNRRAPSSYVVLHRLAMTLAIAGLLSGCGELDESATAARGRGLKVAVLTDRAKAHVYEAALSSAFRLEPALILMFDPVFLPRAAGLAGGKDVPPELTTAIRSRRLIQGSCALPTSDDREVPVCKADGPGYIVRFSDVFRIAPDTVQVHLLAVRFQTPTSGAMVYLRFEKAYRIVGSGDTWRVVAEGRVALAPSRGDPIRPRVP